MGITKKSNVLAILLIVLLVFSMIPAFTVEVDAEESGKSPGISIGAGNIEKGNIVYMGIAGEYGSEPISWLVLGKANSDMLDSNGSVAFNGEDDARLLITEKTIGKTKFNLEWPDIPRDVPESDEWQGSLAMSWCRDFFVGGGPPIDNHFTEIEKDTMLITDKTDREFFFRIKYGMSELKSEQLFFLSAKEAYDYFNGEDGNESRIACRLENEYEASGRIIHAADEPDAWWLRSPAPTSPLHHNEVAYVGTDGMVLRGIIGLEQGARPACNFNLNSVLFTSAYGFIKTPQTMGTNSLYTIKESSTNKWKLTLKDTSRGFKAGAGAGAVLEMNEGYSEWSVPVVYSGACTGENEYVSAILCDRSDNAKYYGHIAKNSAASSDSGQPLTIPTGLEAGSYKLYVFNEQINGGLRSDYASDFSTIELTVKKAAPTSKPPVKEQHTMIKYDATAPTSTEPGNTEYYYCQTCGKYFSDEAGTIEIEKDSWIIPATGEKNEDVIGPTSPKTGDQSNSILWISLLGVAALLAVGAVFVRRKNRKNNE